MGVLKGGLATVATSTDETATGTIDGLNKVFTTTDDYVSGSLTVFLNGLQQSKPGDYSETTSDSFTFVNAPIGGVGPDVVTVRYVKA